MRVTTQAEAEQLFQKMKSEEDNGVAWSLIQLLESSRTVQQDIDAQFDVENFGVNSVNTISNGKTYLLAWGCGDWELEVYFALYWDGEQIRGYLPIEGNPFNTETKLAFGNQEDNEDVLYLRKLYPDKSFTRTYEDDEDDEDDDRELDIDSVRKQLQDIDKIKADVERHLSK